MVAKRDSLLFVYGTLRPIADAPAARWLAEHARYVGPARTRGRLYDLGEYPGWHPPRSKHEWVIGDLYCLQAAEAMLRVLDRYEAVADARGAALFERRRVHVDLLCSPFPHERRSAWLYAYRRKVHAKCRIASGDYLWMKCGDVR